MGLPAKQPDGDVGVAGPHVLAKALGLRVRAGGRGDALAEQAGHDEVQRAQPGQLVPLVGAVYPLEEASAALAEMEERRTKGRTVLRMAQPE